MNFKRSSGIFLHPTSLPGQYGVGSIGKEAFDFVDFLAEAEQDLWQVCPLGPTGYGDSPYQCFSAFAGNPYLIDLERLVERGLITKDDLKLEEEFPVDKVDYGRVINFKMSLLHKAFAGFKKSASSAEISAFKEFKVDNKAWLEDYALFRAVKNSFDGEPWWNWPDEIKFKNDSEVEKYQREEANEIEFIKFIQFLFYKQWAELKDYANRNGVKIVGDIPIFVAMDSSDAWSNPELFHFDEDLKATKVAGVPPDFFSEDGQLWGNPLYDWEALKEQNYKWWIERFESILDLVDIIRIDHFRGFSAYWSVPADAETAKVGHWESAPGADLFEAVKEELGELPIIIEDLGVIDEDVEQLRDQFGFPGMKILQFAFSSDEKEANAQEGEEVNSSQLENEYLPHNYERNCVVYTGTHDNNTTFGWYNNDIDDGTKEFLFKYLADYLEIESSEEDIVWGLLEAAWQSVALFSIAPLQDVLELGSGARMNIPGTASGNWQWRYRKEMLTDEAKQRLRELTEKYNR